MMKWTSAFALGLALAASAFATENDLRFIQVKASTKQERTRLETMGMSIEFVRSDSAWGFADPATLKDVAKEFPVLGNFPPEAARGGHEFDGFPSKDERFHDYAETMQALRDLRAKAPDLVSLLTYGKSFEGRDLVAIHLNTSADAHAKGTSNKPGIVYLGNHHAREHLSLEVPLMLAQYLVDNRAVPAVAALLDSRDIWVIPMVNPDGAEFDVSGNKYHMWRKNRRPNGDKTYGTDLNRNYGYQWGTGGSSASTSSDVYMGPQPFSEPETQAVKSFVDARANLKVLLSFHTYSELILYPWGHTYDSIPNARDLKVFETMAKTMANWNGYTPEQASDLYIASGDTTDWAYGEHGIFAFTFELSPKSPLGGGFYPGQKAIDPTFQANLKPALYLLDAADDPYKVTSPSPLVGEFGYLGPSLPIARKLAIHPIP